MDHSTLPFLLAMVSAIVLLNMLANKLRIAYPILLVLAGLLLSLVPGLPTIEIHPDLIFFLILPPLLFEAAWSISFKEMKKWWRIIGSFAFLVVFFTASSVAVFSQYLIPGFTLALGFLLGGIVSPPDAVSTGAITRFVSIPKSTAAVLEGESLMNDASSLIIFQFAVMAVSTGQFIWEDAALSFLWMVIGGAGIGLLLGWAFIILHKHLPTDAPSDIVLTLIEPYCMYWVAEQFHSSGVMAVVSGGLLMANKRLFFLNSTSRVKGYSVWESFVFILNGIVFLIIGLQLPRIVAGLRSEGIPLSTAIGYGAAVTAALVVLRVICAVAAMAATYLFRPGVLPSSSRRRRWKISLTLGWTGMRGVVSLAAAMAIPVTVADGSHFPHRDLILFITFIVILLTLVVQGLTLPILIVRGRVFEGMTSDENQADKKKMRQSLNKHAHQFLKEKLHGDLKDDEGLKNLLSHWEHKMTTQEEDWLNQKNIALYLDLLEHRRQYLAQINKDPDVDEEIVREQLYQIDLEEERVRALWATHESHN